MQSGSWYLGTPGMTVTSLARAGAGAGGSSVPVPVSSCAAATAVVAAVSAVSAAESAVTIAPCGVTWCWSASDSVVAASGESASVGAGSAVWPCPSPSCWHCVGRHRLSHHCLGGVGLVVGLERGLRGLVRLVVLEPRGASRPVILVGVDVGGRVVVDESSSSRKPQPAQARPWPGRCLRAGPGRRRADSAGRTSSAASAGRLSCPIRAR